MERIDSPPTSTPVLMSGCRRNSRADRPTFLPCLPDTFPRSAVQEPVHSHPKEAEGLLLVSRLPLLPPHPHQQVPAIILRFRFLFLRFLPSPYPALRTFSIPRCAITHHSSNPIIPAPLASVIRDDMLTRLILPASFVGSLCHMTGSSSTRSSVISSARK